MTQSIENEEIINDSSKDIKNSYNLRKNKLDDNFKRDENESKKFKKDDNSTQRLFISDKINYENGSVYNGGMANNMHQGYGSLKGLNFKYDGFWNKGKYDGSGC